jgi:hypothetical protein
VGYFCAKHAEENRMTNRVKVTIGEHGFFGRLQEDLAPNTCAKFRSMLPWTQQLIHVRWSGEGCWIPMGSVDVGFGFENATSHPRPGELIFYPGGPSEIEILLAYGAVSFASKAGQLAGNPFLIIENDLEKLAALGREILWKGAKRISFELCNEARPGTPGAA